MKTEEWVPLIDAALAHHRGRWVTVEQIVEHIRARPDDPLEPYVKPARNVGTVLRWNWKKQGGRWERRRSGARWLWRHAR